MCWHTDVTPYKVQTRKEVVETSNTGRLEDERKVGPIHFKHCFNAAWLTIIKCSLQISIYWWLTC